jgi:hypothetical protein
MVIRKQDFYEGAALYSLIKAAGAAHVRYDAPFFVVDERVALYLKYSTKVRSPWGFTFSAEEHALLEQPRTCSRVTIALICGEDGIATLEIAAFKTIARNKGTASRIACFRRHGEHYGISGPDAELGGKVPPASWQRLLQPGA